MTSSFFLRLSLVCIFSLVSTICGCSLPRNAITPSNAMDGGGLSDSGTVDVGPTDGGPLCTASSCDDANGCTDDSCVPATGCRHVPNTSACDDDVLCNGADTCGGGTCSVHDGVDPCPGDSVCDATSDTCMGCAGPSDCPAPMTGDWTACDFSAVGACTTTGTRSRGLTSYTCVASVCQATTMDESGTCARPTDGDPCDTPVVGAWSACVFANACSEMGTMSRTVTSSRCAAEACEAESMVEIMACARDTDGTVCGAPSAGAFGPCVVGASCSTSGVHERMVTTPYCVAGTCSPIVSTETEACTVGSTDGVSCGAPVCGAFGACMPNTANVCETMGTQTRSCATRTCAAGTCSDGARTMETQACMIPGGAACMTTPICGSCIEDGRTGCRSGRMGHQACSSTTGTCTSIGACIGTLVMTSEVCNCPG